MGLHQVALDIGIQINNSTYDTLYVAFAVAMGASAVIAADGPFLRSMQKHSDSTLSAMMLSLDAWAKTTA
jgi:predicted nucleic acid-binding protein